MAQPELEEAVRDYAGDFPQTLNQAEAAPEPEPPTLFAQAPEADQRDLDVPAFMRRSQF
jgi:hypothetical protein